MKTYRCPVCKKPLSKREYEQALGILGEREKHLHHEREMLQKRFQRERGSLLRAIRLARAEAKKARREGAEAERSRVNRLLAGKSEEIRRLKERVEQLKRGSTPQTEGLELETTLAARLRREFPEDEIRHEGRSGDVLHVVTVNRRPAGRIIYECKRTPNIPSQHISQALQAKRSRDADYAVLVTTGRRRGFNGFEQIKGVIVVAPAAVLPVSSLLRSTLIEIARAKITKAKRAAVAQRLLDFVTSAQFRNPIEEVVHLVDDLRRMVIGEFKEHRRTWKRRWEHYEKIRWDTSQIQKNLQLVLQGREPAPAIVHPKLNPLQLPASTG